MAWQWQYQQQIGGRGFANGNSGAVWGSSQEPDPRTFWKTHDLTPELADKKVDLDEPCPLPFGWKKFLDLKTGDIYYKKDKQMGSETTMDPSGKAPMLDLQLNLTLPPPPPPPPMVNPQIEAPFRGTHAPSGVNINEGTTMPFSDNSGAKWMMLVGCTSCLKYGMTLVTDPKCPHCKGTVLIDFRRQNNANKTRMN